MAVGQAQTDEPLPPPPSGITAVNGPNPGEAVVLWNPTADGAPWYRVGWIAQDDVEQAISDGSDLLERYVFAAVAGTTTSYTVNGLRPGAEYFFTVASAAGRFGLTSATELTSLTMNDDTSACPTAETPVAPLRSGDYDADDDGLIEVSLLAQLDAIRHDLDGDGSSTHPDYAAAFTNALAGMGCPSTGCTGYELTANLDFDTNGSGQPDEGDAYWNGNWGWTPIGDPDEAFRWNATFDGNGHTISNLYISWGDTDHVGLFRATGSDSIIRNVGLASVDVSGQNSVGALAGSNGGTISHSYTAGIVSGNSRVGGLVGSNSGDDITSSYAAVTVTGRGSNIGGLVGSVGNTTIATSWSTGDVAGDGNDVGGLVGSASGATVTASYATGNVSGENYVGGLVGNSSSGGTITASFAMSNVTGRYSIRRFRISGNVRSVSGGTNIGGLVGYSNDTAISASYAISVVSGGDTAVGGFVGGTSGGTIVNSYTATRATRHYASGGRVERQLVGLLGQANDGTSITDSYWDTQVAGLTGQRGKTTRELQSPTANTGIYANWNPNWWDFGTSRQYPALKYGGLDVAAQRP